MTEPWPDPCPDCGAGVVAHHTGGPGLAGEVDLLCSSCPWEMYLPAESTARTRIDALRQIVRDHSARRIDGILVDAVTANLLVTVYAALGREQKARFGKPSLPALVDLAWKHVSPA